MTYEYSGHYSVFPLPTAPADRQIIETGKVITIHDIRGASMGTRVVAVGCSSFTVRPSVELSSSNELGASFRVSRADVEVLHGAPRLSLGGLAATYEVSRDGQPQAGTESVHDYLSTGCLHGDMVLPDGRTGHEYCRGGTGAAGVKTPAQCKFCQAPCRCACHRVAS